MNLQMNKKENQLFFCNFENPVVLKLKMLATSIIHKDLFKLMKVYFFPLSNKA